MLLLLCAILFLNVRAKSQTVNVNVMVPQYNQIFVADLDIEHVKSSGLLFTATLRSTANTPLSVRLRLTVNLSLAGQDPFPNFVNATSNPFTLDPNTTKTITNIDLSSDNSTVTLDQSNYHYDQTEFDKIKNVALATGKAPAGVYQFVLECIDAVNQSQVYGSDMGQIVVTNPSRVDLVLPMDGENVTTLFPHFQWSANSDSVILSVYEKLPNQQSPQDVVSGVPFLRQAVMGGSFNYPPSGPGVRPLESGQTYYWYVEIPPSATRGNGLRSDVWSFGIGVSDTTSASTAALNQEATSALADFLEGTPFESLLAQIASLNGTATYDGQSISIQDLIDILKSMDKSQIKSVTIQ